MKKRMIMTMGMLVLAAGLSACKGLEADEAPEGGEGAWAIVDEADTLAVAKGKDDGQDTLAVAKGKDDGQDTGAAAEEKEGGDGTDAGLADETGNGTGNGTDGVDEDFNGIVMSIDKNVLKLNPIIVTKTEDGDIAVASSAPLEKDAVQAVLSEEAVYTIRQAREDLINSDVFDADISDIRENDTVRLWGEYDGDGAFLADRVEIFRMPDERSS